jgi:hypothetical protein
VVKVIDFIGYIFTLFALVYFFSIWIILVLVKIINYKYKIILGPSNILFSKHFIIFKRHFSSENFKPKDNKFNPLNLKIDDNDSNYNLWAFKQFFIKEERKNKAAYQKVSLELIRKERKLVLVNPGTLNFELIDLKIKRSIDRKKAIDAKNLKIKKNINKEGKEYQDFIFFYVKATSKNTNYIIYYNYFIKERNAFYILFTLIIGKVIEATIIYRLKDENYPYYIFYEIYVHNFFVFMNRFLDEIEVFELYLKNENSIIKNAEILSINLCIHKKLPDKKSVNAV